MKRVKVLKSKILIMLMIPFLLFSSGCIYLVVGGIGAVGGYVVSPDTVEGISDHEMSAVWDAAVEIVSIMGKIKEENKETGMISAVVAGSKVDINIISLSKGSVKLMIKSRKHKLPKISVAQDIFVKIMNYLND